MEDEFQNELLKELLIESFEGLDTYDQEMIALENGSGGADSIRTIFRIIHTLKGGAGFVGLGKIEALAHDGENLLSLLRDEKLEVRTEIVSALLELSDALRGLLDNLESEGEEGDGDFTGLLEKLKALQVSPEDQASAPVEAPVYEILPSEVEAEASQGPMDTQVAPSAQAKSAAASNPAPRAEAASAVKEEPVPKNEPETKSRPKNSVAESAIRVDVNQLDKLMNLVGELVLARNQILQFAGNSQEDGLNSASQRLNIITTELQESVMKTRMQHIGNVWSKFPRVVRDLAKELGKQINLEMEGNETELDRTIIEAIKDPLTHIIRNSVDHGIESPEKREANGKSPQGVLVLRAFHEGGQVNIEIIDDGAGICVDAVKNKAIQRGVITPEQANRMSDREACNLIFSAGFSTAEKVTNVSGRGVGMDVVKTNIEKIGGSVDICSEEGRGTTIRIKIPLTLAIIPALIITTAGEEFAIPQVNLLELVRLEEDQIETAVEMIYGTPVYRLRGELLPLVYLNSELKIESIQQKTADPLDEAINIVVLQADGRQFGLVVDAINDTEEIVVKPLGKQFKNLSFYAGATIMGDGRVALILDVMGVAQRAGVISEGKDQITIASMDDKHAGLEGKSSLLVIENQNQTRMAIPLNIVSRLEEIPVTKVEHTGDRDVVQYREEIMPLVWVADYVTGIGGRPQADEDNNMQVVVYTENNRSVGLVVNKIEDIVEQSLSVQRATHQQGVLGSAVIQDRVTQLLDVEGIVKQADPLFFENRSEESLIQS